MSLVFVISAPSGAGKSTLVDRLRQRDSNCDFAASVTTRPPRDGEVDGEAYSFVSEERFAAMREAGELLEWAEVFGHWYGTPTSAVEAARSRGKDLLLDIDVRGAASLEKKLPTAVTIFVLPPSREDLERRLRDRSSDAASSIERRLGEAAREVGSYASYDHVVINKDVDAAVDRLHAILVSERSKRENMEGAIAPILESFGIDKSPDSETDS